MFQASKIWVFGQSRLLRFGFSGSPESIIDPPHAITLKGLGFGGRADIPVPLLLHGTSYRCLHYRSRASVMPQVLQNSSEPRSFCTSLAQLDPVLPRAMMHVCRHCPGPNPDPPATLHLIPVPLDLYKGVFINSYARRVRFP